MKKKGLALLLALLLVLSMMSGASAAGNITFVAINDTIPLSLSSACAPYYSGGSLFIPYSAYEVSPGGVVVSYNIDKGTFVLFTRAQRLVYDLEAGTVTDENGVTRSTSVTYRGGILFIPAVESASHFGLSVTVLYSETECPIIRFTDGSQVYDNSRFVTKAENLISYMLKHYEQEGEPSYDPSRDDNENDRDPATEDPAEEKGPATVYLAFAGDSVSPQTLELLDRLELKAAFFLTAEQFRDRNLARAIYASGHTIGVAHAAGEAPEAAWNAANEAMDDALFCRTILALSDQTVETPSYRVLTERAITVEEILEQPETPYLCVCRADASALVEALMTAEASVPLLTETTQIQ